MSERTVSEWLVHRPPNQDIPGSDLTGGIYLSFLLTSFYFLFFHLLCDLIFTRGCNFVTRLAKHSSQKFYINTRNIHKDVFSCNLLRFVGVCNIAVEAYWLATGRVWCVFSLFSFCLLVSDKFGQKYDLFSLLGTGKNLLGAWGWCKRPWSGHCFYCFKVWAGYIFAGFSHGSDTFFHYLEAKWEDIYRKKWSCSFIFHWNSRQWLKCSCTYRSELEKKTHHREQPVQRILWVVIFLDDSTYEKKTIYCNIKYFVS